MSPSKPVPHVAMLRALNVGKRTLPMPTLAGYFADGGAEAVSTYIQSGNVVFRATPAVAAKLPAAVAQAIRAGHGFDSPVILRTAAELADVVARNPYPEAAEAPTTLHVVFLDAEPTKAAIASLDPDRSPGDSFMVLGREVYLHVPKGFGQTKFTVDWFEKKLKANATIRNWRTTLELLARAGALAEG